MNAKKENYSHSVKTILLGDSGTGKSTLFQRLQVNRKWVSNLRPTIGVEFIRQIISVSNESLGLQIWDLAGSERYRRISESFFRANDATLLVYDITNEKSFINLQDWLKSHGSYGDPDARIFVIGNKCELEDDRQVSYEDGRLFAEKNSFLFFEVSAKTLENVDYLLKFIGQELLGKFIEKKAKGTEKNYKDAIVIDSKKEDLEVNLNNNAKNISSTKNSTKEDDSKSRCNVW